ncbi:MAG: hypothetical protein HUU03_13985 [Planctomycetaceae bacterium]|nr:hypothetical protein [Planctomycetota bacterium]NUO17538.1 hypothetical protein [Planctomycetaceae bacterium]GIK52672.1 MAG: hypothetical protein BroJett014_16450 [Planctomycetota bacterium]
MRWLRTWGWQAAALLLLAALALSFAATPAEGKEVYCAQQEGGADAVLTDKAAPFGKLVKRLKLNDVLEVLDESSSKTHIRVRSGGVEGWVKRSAISTARTEQGGDSVSSGTDSSKAGAAAKGLNKEIENEVSASDPKYREAMGKVDTLEIAVHEQIGGGNQVIVTRKTAKGDETENVPKDSEKMRNSYSGFGTEGGLLKLNP